MTESQIQKEIIEYCNLTGFRVERMNTGAAKMKGFWVKFGFKGMPDLLVFVGPYSLWLEIKDAKGKLTPEQVEFATFCGLHAVPYALCRSLADARAAIMQTQARPR